MANISNKNRLKRNKTKQNFLLSFFRGVNGYAEKEINGFFLIHQLNKLKNWEVAIFDKDGYFKRKSYLKSRGNGESEIK